MQTNPTPDALVERVAQAIYAERPDGGYWLKPTGTSGHPEYDFTKEFTPDTWDEASEKSREDCRKFARAALAAMQERIERLEYALNLAANRLQRCSVDYDTGTRQFIEVGEWAEEARTALGRGE